MEPPRLLTVVGRPLFTSAVTSSCTKKYFPFKEEFVRAWALAAPLPIKRRKIDVQTNLVT